MVNGIINGFMKVSGQNYLEHSSYALSKFFFEELKKLSPPKLHHIWRQRRHQKLRLALIFNMTIQLFVEFKNRGARAKLKILKFWTGNFTFIWFQIKSQILSFALAPLFLNTTKSWMVILKIRAILNFWCLLCPQIWFSLGGDSVLSSSKKTLRGHNSSVLNHSDPKPSWIHLLFHLPSIKGEMEGIKKI